MQELSYDSQGDGLTLTLGHLYPDQLNIYGDRGNILTLRQRCRWRGLTLRVVALELGDPLDPADYDLLFIGGGQDKEQSEVARDLRERKAEGLRAAVEADMPVLAVCGGYQLLARYYRPAEGPDLLGAGIFDAWTVHKGKAVARCVGNVALAWEGGTLVGFENHGGRAYLAAGGPPPGGGVGGGGGGRRGKNGEAGGGGGLSPPVWTPPPRPAPSPQTTPSP